MQLKFCTNLPAVLISSANHSTPVCPTTALNLPQIPLFTAKGQHCLLANFSAFPCGDNQLTITRSLCQTIHAAPRHVAGNFPLVFFRVLPGLQCSETISFHKPGLCIPWILLYPLKRSQKTGYQMQICLENPLFFLYILYVWTQENSCLWSVRWPSKCTPGQWAGPQLCSSDLGER